MTRLSSIARKVGVDEAEIERSRPTRVVSQKRQATVKEPTSSLLPQFNDNETRAILAAAKAFQNANPKGLMKSKGKADGTGSAPAKSGK